MPQHPGEQGSRIIRDPEEAPPRTIIRDPEGQDSRIIRAPEGGSAPYNYQGPGTAELPGHPGGIAR